MFGAAALLDFFQWLLDWMAIGFILNEMIDPVVGFFLARHFRSRGVKMDGKKLTVWILGPLIEMLTDGLLPIGWMAEVATTYLMDKADKETSQLDKSSPTGHVVGSIRPAAEDQGADTRDRRAA